MPQDNNAAPLSGLDESQLDAAQLSFDAPPEIPRADGKIWDEKGGNWIAPAGKKTDAERLEQFAVRFGSDTAIPNLEDNWLIRDIMPMNGAVAMYGAPGSGKSFQSLSMALFIAAGRAWCGKEVEQGLVVYVALEGGGVFSNRVFAATKHHHLTDDELANFATINATVNLREKDSGAELRHCLTAIENHTDKKIVLLIVDTLNRAFGGGNENSPEDMGQLIGELDTIREQFDTTVQLVHHSGKDVAQGMRGHSSLIGAVDTEIKIERNDEGRLMTISKQRDGEDGEQFGFRIEGFDVGTSPKGHPVKSAVAVPADKDAIKAANKKTAQGTNQTIVVNALKQLTAEPEAKKKPSGTGWPEAGLYHIVSVDDLLNHAKGKITPPEEGKKDRRREHLLRSLNDMIEKDGLCMNDGFVWDPKMKITK
ncbi:DNA repair and recombination protein RadB [Shimia thalassica]|uniref:DNA repair and recombination protein RadB n=1 Tax=Shimia thalassica TaxID=1715693 RepID=A0A0P1IDQ3_9RHOB|nr:AAA family ATPase [Shimia thalassica]CUJ84230.1 DNA repair and recombination protein RadB [Shimia thalassica]